MIAAMPLWVFVAAFAILLGIFLVVRGLRMPAGHEKDRQRRDQLKRRKVEKELEQEEK